jgi:hypothetical protein
VTKRGLTKNKVLLCVWWNCRGVVYKEY